MKKIIYILLVAFATTMSLSACTEEEVSPSTEFKKSSGATPTDPL